MDERRYAIVRVDNICPPIKMFCSARKIDCKNCLYGDTKEQLIRKVAQVIRRYRKNLDICEYCDMKDEFEIAEKVVEFLGVE